jgi:hypothetical protein
MSLCSEPYFPIIQKKHNPPLGGAMKLYLPKKIPKESNESQSYNIEKTKAIEEY